MKTLGQSIKVTPNYSKRTFTIRTYIDGKVSLKYRTYVMTREEFYAELYNTDNDWLQFLKTDGYYVA